MLEKKDFQILQTMMQETVRKEVHETVKKEVHDAVKTEMQTSVRKEIQDAFDVFDKRMDEKIDKKIAASESFLLDEIDRSHQSLKRSIENLRDEVREMKYNMCDEKARDDCNTLFHLYHEQQTEIDKIKAVSGM